MIVISSVETISMALGGMSDESVANAIKVASDNLLEQVGDEDTFLSLQVTQSVYTETDGELWIIINIMLLFGKDEDKDNEEQIPELGSGKRKVTMEVFNFVHAMHEKGFTDVEIVEMFDNNISESTISKVRRAYSFTNYCYTN